MALAASTLVLLFGGLSVRQARQGDGGPRPTQGEVQQVASSTPSSRPTATPNTAVSGTAEEVGYLDRLRRTPQYHGSLPVDVIQGDDSQQPDLYAAAFARRLLTQDYQTPRADLLAWVQAESAQSTEPLVVGLVPSELRDRFAVYSVTDATSGPAPIPSEDDWRGLATRNAATTAVIDRVIEPQSWSNAVDAGRIQDPGVTARQVHATVTRSVGTDTTTYSVEVTINLEGPPSRAGWGFVTLLTYTSIPVGTP